MLGNRGFSFLLILGDAALSAGAHHSSLQVLIVAGPWMNGATPPPTSSTYPSTGVAAEGASNKEPNEAERIGGLPPEGERESAVPMLDGHLRQTPSSCFQLKPPLTRHQSALSYGRPSGRPPVLACKNRSLIDKETEINSQFGPGMSLEWKIPFSFLCSLQGSSQKYDERSRLVW